MKSSLMVTSTLPMRKSFDTLSRGNVGLLKSFKRFVAYKTTLGQPISDSDWLSITTEEFD